MITKRDSGTNVHQISPGIYRVSTPISIPRGPDNFSFDQYLVVDEALLLSQTGPRGCERLRGVGFSHFAADEALAPLLYRRSRSAGVRPGKSLSWTSADPSPLTDRSLPFTRSYSDAPARLTAQRAGRTVRLQGKRRSIFLCPYMPLLDMLFPFERVTRRLALRLRARRL